MRADLVTTRSLPFGFRSVNRKLQPRLVCNEHNGDGSRVKVGQLERGKQTSERQRAKRERNAPFFPPEKIKGRKNVSSSVGAKQIDRLFDVPRVSKQTCLESFANYRATTAAPLAINLLPLFSSRFRCV